MVRLQARRLPARSLAESIFPAPTGPTDSDRLRVTATASERRDGGRRRSESHRSECPSSRRLHPSAPHRAASAPFKFWRTLAPGPLIRPSRYQGDDTLMDSAAQCRDSEGRAASAWV